MKHSTSMKAMFALMTGALLTVSIPHSASAADAPAAAGKATAAAATWAQIDKNLAQVEGQIQAGKIEGNFGGVVYGIANAFQTLPGQSASLTAAQQEEVKRNIPVVGGAVSKIDQAADKKDMAGAKANLQTLKSTLATVRAFYQH